MPLPTWTAVTVTFPAPVNVTVFPESVAGPDSIVKVTGSPEDAVAEMENGVSRKVWEEIAPNPAMVCVSPVTEKTWSTESAAKK